MFPYSTTAEMLNSTERVLCIYYKTAKIYRRNGYVDRIFVTQLQWLPSKYNIFKFISTKDKENGHKHNFICRLGKLGTKINFDTIFKRHWFTEWTNQLFFDTQIQYLAQYDMTGIVMTLTTQ